MNDQWELTRCSRVGGMGKGPEQKEAFQELKDGCGLEFRE